MGAGVHGCDVLTLGTFDILHAGHARFLAEAARFGRLTVGVNSDRFVRTYKPAPLNGCGDRMCVISSLSSVERVIVNDGPGRALIQGLVPRVLAVGPDWLERDYLGQVGMTADELFGQGTVLAFMPPARREGMSSTALRSRR